MLKKHNRETITQTRTHNLQSSKFKWIYLYSQTWIQILHCSKIRSKGIFSDQENKNQNKQMRLPETKKVLNHKYKLWLE